MTEHARTASTSAFARIYRHLDDTDGALMAWPHSHPERAALPPTGTHPGQFSQSANAPVWP